MKIKTFTLLELLVVISILGILMTLLMPSLRSARDASRSAVCKSNMKQLSYLLINPQKDGRFMAYYNPKVNFEHYWVQELEGFVRVSKDAFKDSYSTKNTYWYCPGFENTTSFGKPGFVHYAYNNITPGNNSIETDYYIVGGGKVQNNIPLPKPGGFIARISEPSDVLMLADSVHWGVNHPRGSHVFSQIKVELFRYASKKRFNSLFVDGHIESISINLSPDFPKKLMRGTWR